MQPRAGTVILYQDPGSSSFCSAILSMQTCVLMLSPRGPQMVAVP